MAEDHELITASKLAHDLTAMGIAAGQTVMLHVSVKAIGWMVGGPQIVLQTLLDMLTPAGTLMMYCAWEDRTDDWQEWSAERQAIYRAEYPAFDPATSRANRYWSILTEYLRTMPGAFRSANPGASMVAVGAQAKWLTDNHPLQYGYGDGSPLAKLVECGGKVLLVGVPIDTITLLHHSEHVAQVPNKRILRYEVPILRDGRREWIEIEEFDTSEGIVIWEGGEYFGVIAQAFLDSGQGRQGKVGAAQATLFDAAMLHRFAVRWMEEHFAK